MLEQERLYGRMTLEMSSDFVAPSVEDLFYNEDEKFIQQAYSAGGNPAQPISIALFSRKDLIQNHKKEELRLFHKNNAEQEHKMAEDISRIVAKNHITIASRERFDKLFDHRIEKHILLRELDTAHWENNFKLLYLRTNRQWQISENEGNVLMRNSETISREKSQSIINRIARSVFSTNRIGEISALYSTWKSLWRGKFLTQTSSSLNQATAVTKKKCEPFEPKISEHVIEINPESLPQEYGRDILADKWLCLNIAEGKFSLDKAIDWVVKAKEFVRTLETAQLKQVVMTDFTQLTPTERVKGRKYFAQNSALFKRYLKDEGFEETFDNFAERIISVYRAKPPKE